MKLGIDFGTTRIVAAAVDRGNYPVITFEDSEGAAREWFPPSSLRARRAQVRLGRLGGAVGPGLDTDPVHQAHA